ncbi:MULTISPECIES: thiol peroxidase [unclassified Schaalia]|uniref:thiol peroxidase n=1 Tax=unclassified Schaalia TaxID=2691889 RepID=UPI001E2B8D00|nr:MULTISPECIES: thiol peroxidase [unclassified Schaalia]MCD4550333.1 thiol peroxidase [Schaalia sp. lx-260]MCD4557761.1 thiol peroxidase [Schaalia sp. lx-100]
MATTHLQGKLVHTIGELPAHGTQAPEFTVVGSNLEDIQLSTYAGYRIVLNIFPSVDTGICATSVRTFNQHAATLENTRVLCISHDLPFALQRFCAAEGIDNVTVASAFRSDFANLYGVRLIDSPLKDLCARSIIILDTSGIVRYTQLVNEIRQDPDYEQALAALARIPA